MEAREDGEGPRGGGSVDLEGGGGGVVGSSRGSGLPCLQSTDPCTKGSLGLLGLLGFVEETLLVGVGEHLLAAGNPENLSG